MVGGVHDNQGKEAIVKCLIKHLVEATAVARLHGFIILVLFYLLLYPVNGKGKRKGGREEWGREREGEKGEGERRS